MADDFEIIPDAPATDKSMFWNPLKNPAEPRTIEGEVIEVKEGKYGRDLVLNTRDGKRQTPSHKNLQAKCAKVNPGQYVRITLTGEKSVGKGSKMQVYEVGIRKGYQATIPQPQQPVDAAGKLLAVLKTAPAGLLDNAFWDEVKKAADNLGDGVRLVDRLKQEGRIYNQGGFWKAT